MVRYYHLELLACPECKNPRLIVYPLKEALEGVPERPESLKCRRWCYLYDRPASVVPVRSCVETCVARDIAEGVIVCPSCGRWYPIIDGIPVMMDDKYRREERDREIAEKMSDRIPGWIRLRARLPIQL